MTARRSGVDETTIYEIPAGTQPQAVPPADRPPARARGGRLWIVSALVGAVVGAAVSGGIVAATRTADRQPAPVGSPPPSAAPAISARLGEPGSIAAILEKVEPAVVSINTQGFGQDDVFSVLPREGAGTGVVLTPDGDVLTNAHVIADAAAIKVKLATGDRTYDATLLGSDPAADVALIRVQGVSNLTVAKLARSADLRVAAASSTWSRPMPPSTPATRGARWSTRRRRSSGSTPPSSPARARPMPRTSASPSPPTRSGR